MAIPDTEEATMNAKGPVLVTGASTGIGRCIAETLAGNDCLVYAAARRRSDLQSLASVRNVVPLKLDVTKQADVEGAVKEVRSGGKGLYGLVNNAGIGDLWPLGELGDEALRWIFEVNVFGVHRVTRAMLPFLMEARGRIVDMSSIGGLLPYSMRGAYCMTKFSIEAYSEVLHQELEKYGVRVSIIEPTYFRTNANKSATKLVQDRAASARPAVMKAEIDELMGSLAEITVSWQKRTTPEKVAEAVSEALFSKHPKFRYFVSTEKGQALQPIEALMARAVEIGANDQYAFGRSELHSILDRMWDDVRGRPC